MAAQAVCHMPLGRISAHTTSNVGVIECDGATNVVPGTCWLSGECRSTSLERARAERLAKDISGWSEDLFGALNAEPPEFDGYDVLKEAA